MGAICISYRPDDAEDEARRLYDELVQRFGEAAVRLDPESTGSEAPRASCSVLLTMIGRRWLYAANERGQRRLGDPGDGVRRGALSALQLDVPLVPVLVQGAHMPHAAQLPTELAGFAFQNAVELTRAHWSSDVSVLVRVLSRHVALTSAFLGADEAMVPGAPAGRRRWVAPLVTALAIASLGLGGLGYAMRFGEDRLHRRVASLQRDPDGEPGADRDRTRGGNGRVSDAAEGGRDVVQLLERGAHAPPAVDAPALDGRAGRRGRATGGLSVERHRRQPL